jgi:DNA-binding NarL/FixJ family response regulator
LLADDHELVRAGIRARLETETDLTIVGEAHDGEEAVHLAEKLKPDVVVMDVSMPNLNGLEATTLLRQRGFQCGVLILSIFDAHEYVRGALDAGANGYILKDVSANEMIRAIRTVASGGLHLSPDVAGTVLAAAEGKTNPSDKANEPYGLTPREKDVLRLVASGKTNKQIADDLTISVRTVESHRQNLREKLDGGNAMQLMKVAQELGLT